MDIRQLINRTIKMEIEDEETIYRTSKKKRLRSAFTTDQIKGLEKQYKKYPYIGIVNRKAIAKSLNIPDKAVKIWFQNRRMKEKKDKTQNNYKETHNAVKLVNNQSRNSSALQSSNDPVSNSIPPQKKPRTGLLKERGYNYQKSYAKQANNVIITVETDMENDNIMANSVTSSTNDKNTTESSVELSKKYRNHLYSTTERPRQKIFSKSGHEVTDKSKDNTYPKFLQQATYTSTSLPQRHNIPQIPIRYVPTYAQNTQSCYQQACLPVSNDQWKSMEPNMANVMPVNQFALVPHATTQNLNTHGRKCFCNCHGSSQQNPVYPQENQLLPPQYVFAVPFHNAPAHFTYPIQR